MAPDLTNFPLTNKYAGFSSNTYNAGLRGNPTAANLKSEEELNLELDKLESYANKTAYAHDTHTRIPFNILSKWYLKRIGQIVEFPNFLSSSNYKWAGQNDTVYEIQTSDKSKSRYISNVVGKPSEQEVLFKSYSLFQIQSVDDETSTIYLKEVEEADIKITLKDGIFLSDSEVEKLLKKTRSKDNNNQLSLSDLGLI
jgi:hypothetical protein